MEAGLAHRFLFFAGDHLEVPLFHARLMVRVSLEDADVMDERGDGLEAVHDRQERGRDQRGEDGCIDGETAGLFRREVVTADVAEGSAVETRGCSAGALEVVFLVGRGGGGNTDAVLASARFGTGDVC